jgi:diphthamide biosynthesis methyltransferase
MLQPLTPQTLALVAAAIHCGLSDYAAGKKVTVMFSQDEYRDQFCPSTVIDYITAEAIALIKFKLHMVGLLSTTPPNGAPPL